MQSEDMIEVLPEHTQLGGALEELPSYSQLGDVPEEPLSQTQLDGVPEELPSYTQIDVALESMDFSGSIPSVPIQRLFPHLIRSKNHTKIPVNKPIFRIGRNTDQSDYVIDGNAYVGRTHCHIVLRDGEYFLVDHKSKNHTYLDGKEIQGGVEVKIEHGAKIRLANEEFEFRYYDDRLRTEG